MSKIIELVAGLAVGVNPSAAVGYKTAVAFENNRRGDIDGNAVAAVEVFGRNVVLFELFFCKVREYIVAQTRGDFSRYAQPAQINQRRGYSALLSACCRTSSFFNSE